MHPFIRSWVYWDFSGDFTNVRYRLRKTGIVDIENPVAKAFQEGRFEELPDNVEDD